MVCIARNPSDVLMHRKFEMFVVGFNFEIQMLL